MSPSDPLVQSLIQAGVEAATDSLTAKLAELEAGQAAHAVQLQVIGSTVANVVTQVADHATAITEVANAVSGKASASELADLAATVAKLVPHVVSWIGVKLSHFFGHSDPSATLDSKTTP